MQANRSVQLPLAALAGAIAVFAGLGMAMEPLAEWSGDAFDKIAGTFERAGETGQPLSSGRPEEREKRGCDHCAIVVSTQRIAAVGDAPPKYEITVRLADRSTRVFSDSNAHRWRPGERIVLIEGGSSPRD